MVEMVAAIQPGHSTGCRDKALLIQHTMPITIKHTLTHMQLTENVVIHFVSFPLDLTICLNHFIHVMYHRNDFAILLVSVTASDLSHSAAAQLSCQLSARDLSTTSSAMDTATLTLDPESCPFCAKALTNESEGGTEGNETPGDSDSDGVYEFTQDLHHRDRRDSRQPKKKHRRLGKTAAKVVRFWRLVCDTFRKIVDSKYFGRGIMIAILINTLSMGIEYHEQVSVYVCFCMCN